MADTTNIRPPDVPDDPSSNEMYRFGESLLNRAKLVAQTITERVRLAMSRARANDSSGRQDCGSEPTS